MTDFADLQRDSGDLGELVNENKLVTTRYGGNKKSWQYLVDEFSAEFAEQLLEINKSRGYRVVGTFAAGFDYELFNDVGIDVSGNSWIYVGAGAPAKTVTAGTVPSAPDYQQVTYNSIDGVVGLRDELNARALELTLAEAQAKTDLVAGQTVILTDYNYAPYKVVLNTDTDGIYKEGLQGGVKLKLVIRDEFKSSWVGAITGDATVLLQTIASLTDGCDVVFDSDVDCSITSQVAFVSPKSLDFGDSKISFDAASVSKPLVVGSDDLTLLHTTTVVITDSDSQIDVTTTAGVVRGRYISLYNPTDSSWSGFRPAYRQGEYLRVAGVSGNTLLLEGKVSDASYPIGSEVYLLPTNSVKVTGKVKLINTGTYATSNGLELNCLANSDYTGLQVEVDNGTSALTLRKNVDGGGDGMLCSQKSSQVSGLNYGIVYDSCQNIRNHGRFHGERHGSTIGTDGSPGSAINRDILTTGYVTTTGQGSVQAADIHGNAERCGYGGYLEGYIFGGRDSYLVKGTKVVSPKTNFAPIQGSELKSTNHDLSGAVVECDGMPSSRGVVDVGGNTDVISANTTIGGTLNFKDMKILGPTTTQGAFRIRNRGANVDFNVDFSGTTTFTPSSSFAYVLSTVSGSSPKVVTFSNDDWGNGVSVDATTKLIGLTQVGEYTFTTDTGTNFDSRQITFDLPFPSGREPVVTVSDDKSIIGASRVLSEGSNHDELSFFSNVFTIDGTNFASATVVTVRWKAEI